jgi:hypothetical protein
MPGSCIKVLSPTFKKDAKVFLELSTTELTGTVSLESLLEEEKSGHLSQKIEDGRYKVRPAEQGFEVVDTESESATRFYDSFGQMEQDLEAYDPSATSGRYAALDVGEGTIIYDRENTEEGWIQMTGGGEEISPVDYSEIWGDT